MKSDACLLITAEPLHVPLAPLKGLCAKEIKHPEIVCTWDEVPTGTKLDTEQLVGICSGCKKKLKELQTDGTHMLYAVREFVPKKGHHGSNETYNR